MNDAHTPRPADSVDAILAQWRRERPELDARPMGPIGRIKRCAGLLEPQLEAALAEFELTVWEFDMLATLRRAGQPYCLSPTELFSSLMVTSGTMTHRLKRMEARQFIERVPNAQDARSMLVQLTASGLSLINRAVEVFVEHERQILSRIPAEVLADLDDKLARLLVALEGEPGQGGSGAA